MILFGDYHTHTIYTHGKSTIEENVLVAIKKGLKEVAITEHSYKHFAHPVKRKNIKVMREEVDRLNKKYPEIKILLGLECNLLGVNGEIDLTDEEEKMLDLVVLGYHKTFKPTFKNFFKFLIPNTFRIGQASKKRIEINTNAYINAMKKHKIDILAHLKYANCTVDVKKIADFAGTQNTYIELNGKRINFTDEEILDVVNSNAKFIIDSDAHICDKVGENNHALNILTRLNIPQEKVANIGKTPTFKNHKG